mmetsp:Transcript_134/g.484  ORF Transcript_134/g.484 Transcript_134/m.484 type:complete len:350 (-) Transcript_134:134-1183(-)
MAGVGRLQHGAVGPHRRGHRLFEAVREEGRAHRGAPYDSHTAGREAVEVRAGPYDLARSVGRRQDRGTGLRLRRGLRRVGLLREPPLRVRLVHHRRPRALQVPRRRLLQRRLRQVRPLGAVHVAPAERLRRPKGRRHLPSGVPLYDLPLLVRDDGDDRRLRRHYGEYRRRKGLCHVRRGRRRRLDGEPHYDLLRGDVRRNGRRGGTPAPQVAGQEVHRQAPLPSGLGSRGDLLPATSLRRRQGSRRPVGQGRRQGRLGFLEGPLESAAQKSRRPPPRRQGPRRLQLQVVHQGQPSHLRRRLRRQHAGLHRRAHGNPRPRRHRPRHGTHRLPRLRRRPQGLRRRFASHGA